MTEQIKFFLLNLIPMAWRKREPFKKYYWQQEEIDEAREEAKRLMKIFGWDRE